MNKEILDRELSPEDEVLLRESLNAWKEDIYAKLVEDVEQLKAQKIEELEEANASYLEEIKDEYATKFVNALAEMKQSLRAEVISEMVDTNPELQILEKIKELIAPTLNEEYISNLYAQEIQTLREENAVLQRNSELEEGARTLAELLSPYSDKTREIVLSLIKEGNSDEVTEQFYNLMEGLKLIEEDDSDDDSDEPKAKKKAKKDSEDDSEDDSDDDSDDDDDDSEDDSDEDDSDDDDLDDDDDSEDKGKKKGKKGSDDDDEMKEDSFIQDDEKGKNKTSKKHSLLEELKNLAS